MIAGAMVASEANPFGRHAKEIVILLAMFPGFAVSFIGFLGLALVQIGRAGVDSAEYSQQTLKVARDQLEVSRQALRSPNTTPTSFAATVNPNSASDPPFSRYAPDGQQATQKNEPRITTSAPRTFRYRSKDIQIENGKYLYNGITFDTREKAERYIDTFAGPGLPNPDTV